MRTRDVERSDEVVAAAAEEEEEDEGKGWSGPSESLEESPSPFLLSLMCLLVVDSFFTPNNTGRCGAGCCGFSILDNAERDDFVSATPPEAPFIVSAAIRSGTPLREAGIELGRGTALMAIDFFPAAVDVTAGFLETIPATKSAVLCIEGRPRLPPPISASTMAFFRTSR